MTATLKLPDATRRVVDLETGKALPVSGNTLTLDFKSSRGRLLLLEGEKN